MKVYGVLTISGGTLKNIKYMKTILNRLVWSLIKVFYSIYSKILNYDWKSLISSLSYCINTCWLQIITSLIVWFILYILWIKWTIYLENSFGMVFCIIYFVWNKILTNVQWKDWYERIIRDWRLAIVVLIASTSLLCYFLERWQKKAN